MEQQRQQSNQAQNKAPNQHDSGATQTNRRLLIPSSKAVAVKMLGMFREEVGVLLNKEGWTNEDKKAFERYKEVIRLVERF